MQLEHHSEVLLFICEPHQLCHRCRLGSGRFQAGELVFRLLALFNNSVEGWQVSVSLQYLSDISLSPLGIVCSGGAKSMRDES